ncbi:DUF1214 domain-containing protein [Gilvimarinus sp. SDUM040013]|uniref:DUF1214 domain-containing protein n=1 Tax=Gilvimarinus gilvus TaxID=3058038 RepID=A0ABU4S125_9GAMM|nr:DUF1214 domain-containing protein [Gilvimarinus sp. SDUM040013]MDO3385814.1 DUF1214 domain-containing protein [Gilvimarinus sp. SDUM040013]MDX6850624.1 DUF1214 domain-containing protein [Gilvimarinus sp. SDUM040013]
MTSMFRTCIAAAVFTLMSASCFANSDETVHVDVLNYITAQTAMQFETYQKNAGGINKVLNIREPVPLDKQDTIRMNRDTIYSFAVVDISKGATITLPDAGSRYRSMMVVNEDNYINEVYLDSGRHLLTKEKFDSDYVWIVIRTLVDSNSIEDVRQANKLQDEIQINANSAKPFVVKNYDMDAYKKTLDALLELGKGVADSQGWFGSKEETTPIGHLVGTAVGFGGLPKKHAFYLNVNPELPVGEYKLSVKDVPVRAFWSVSLYNSEGYFQENAKNAYSYNSVNAVKNSDGSITIHFGGCDDGRVNCLPIMDGWNYGVRLYEPEQSVLDGSYVFPTIEKL